MSVELVENDIKILTFFNIYHFEIDEISKILNINLSTVNDVILKYNNEFNLTNSNNKLFVLY